MSENARHELIDKLQATINKILMPLLPKSGPFALLDFPTYANVGDSAIWLGELSFFQAMIGRRPSYVCTTENFSPAALEDALPEGPIFLCGGGNFGDIWPVHQELREHVLQRFPDRKVVQLPQSIHFNDRKALRRTADIISSHPDFTLLVRDHKSFDLAKESFDCRVELCPDMAFCLGSLDKPIKPSRSLLLLMRTDIEKVHITGESRASLPAGTVVADWVDDEPDMQSKIRHVTIRQLIPQLGFKALNKHSRRELLYRRLAEARLRRGLRLLASAEFIITDRLHAHILSTLLGLPHIRLDNSYGKLSGFAEVWTSELAWVYAEESLDSALERFSVRIDKRQGLGLAQPTANKIHVKAQRQT